MVKEWKINSEATANVFSDNCTHLLNSSTVTLGFSKATLALSTQTVSTVGRRSSKDLVMVLDQSFPAGSTERTKLVIQLRTDVHQALATISQASDVYNTVTDCYAPCPHCIRSSRRGSASAGP